jgi:HSP20 family protein
MPGLLDEEWMDTSDYGLNVYETDDEVVVEANVAGVPEDKVEVSVEGGVVTVKAQHEESEEKKQKKKVVYQESRRAQYLYTAKVPCPVQASRAEAEVENGVLTLTLPKGEEVKPKQIKVKTKSKK